MGASKAELIAAFSEMHSLACDLYSTYQNDVQVDRAGAMQAIYRRVNRCATVLHRIPYDEIEAAVQRFPREPKP